MSGFYTDDVNGNEVELTMEELPIAQKLGIVNIRLTPKPVEELMPLEYEEPLSEEPVSEEPLSEEPLSEEPVSEEPVSEEPVSEEPVSEEPVSEEPVPEEIVPEEPVSEEPVSEEIVPEEPVSEEIPNVTVEETELKKGGRYTRRVSFFNYFPKKTTRKRRTRRIKKRNYKRKTNRK